MPLQQCLPRVWPALHPALPRQPSPPESLSEPVTQHVRIDSPRLALTGLQLIDGSGTPAWRDQTILIEEGRIRAVGDSVDVTAPKGSRW